MDNKIKCPNCEYQFDVEEALAKQVQSQIEKEWKEKLDKQKNLMEEEHNQIIEEAKARAMAEGEEKLKAKLEDLEKENEKRKKENRNLKEKEVELLRKQKELKEKEDDMQLEMEKTMMEKQQEIEDKIMVRAEQKFELERKDMERKLEDARKQASEIERKAKLGSQQSQGETQEEAIETYLGEKFPLDSIEEIKKGERGADCMQIVHTRTSQNCGRIYYESKRAKNFNINWIEKFKNDIREKGADIGVLVTQVLPDELDRMGLLHGVWICTFEEFKGLSAVLRQTIIRLHEASEIQENKGDKMSLLYDYLTGTEFRLNVEGIVEGFIQMKEDIDREKRSMTSLWKRREKQIEKVILNTNYFYSSIKGIAGNAIQTVEALELPGGDEEED